MYPMVFSCLFSRAEVYSCRTRARVRVEAWERRETVNNKSECEMVNNNNENNRNCSERSVDREKMTHP